MTEPHPIPNDPRFQDLTGKRFGRWLVVGFLGNGRRSSMKMWWCRCECGTEKKVYGSSLRTGQSKSCGCFHKERTAQTGRETRTHGMSKTPEFAAWISMKQRCCNPHHQSAHNYIERGITIYREWLNSFEAFFAYVGHRPTPKHTLERKDNEKGYEPGNVRWATMKEQALNKRTNRLVPFQGEMLPLAEASRRAGLDYGVVRTRLHNGWSVERALQTPVKSRRREC